MDGGRSMPEHVLFEILVWLPVLSLLRFKTVCKSWFALIESSTFITKHLHHHSGKGSLLAFYRNNYESNVPSRFCLLSGNRYEVYTDLDFKEQWYTTIGYDFEMIDSCNGIICLHNNSTGDVVLWNPALKQLRHVPKSSIHNCPSGKAQACCIGFGYDAKTNDYKLVRIIWYWAKPGNQVEIYSFRSSLWKVICKNDALPFTCIDNFHGVHATSRDGICFWVGRDDNKKVCLLVSFDLKDEVFQTMSLPDDQCPGGSYAMNFLNDKLVYIKAANKDPSDTYNEYFEIWVLHEFGVKESWKKTRYPLHFMLRIIGFTKNGDILVLQLNRRHRQLHLYNLVTQESYPLNPQEGSAEVVHVLDYNESLVSIKIS